MLFCIIKYLIRNVFSIFVTCKTKDNVVKRNFSISFVAFAVAILMMLTLLPHHHHGDIACVEIERCEADDAVNDIHTDHHDEESGRHTDESECFLSTRNYVVINHHFSFDHKFVMPSLMAFLSADLFLVSSVKVLVTDDASDEYHIYYKSALLKSTHSFRAPPVA